MKSNVKNKKEKKQKGLFISWIDLILYFIISCLLAFVCVLDTVSMIGEDWWIKRKICWYKWLYILWFMIWYIIWDILIIHYFYGYLLSQIIKLIKEHYKNIGK